MSKKNEGTDDPSFTKGMGTQEYSTQLTRKLNNLRKESTLCDVTIIVGEQHFPAHKAVLSCASDYFQGMFATGFQESSLSEVTIPGTAACFAELLEFAYTGHFSLSLDKALGILRMACYMMMQDAMKHCATYLQKVTTNLSMDDCFEVWTIAANHDILQDLAKASKNRLAQNFPECGKSSVFLENASFDVMLDMVTDEDIETDECGEEQIIEVVKAWLRHDWEHRKPHTADLLKKLRLGLLPMDTIQKVLGDEILNIPDCKTRVEEVQTLNAFKELKEDTVVPLVQSHPDLFATRNTVTGQVYSMEWQGITYKTTSGCYLLERLNKSPIKCPYVEGYYYKFLVVNDTTIYIAGGYGDEAVYEGEKEESPELEGSPEELERLHKSWLEDMNFCKFDLDSNECVVLPPMNIVVGHFHLHLHTFDDDYIYVVGYKDKFVIQRYSLISNEWEDHVNVEIPENPELRVGDHAVIGQYILFFGEDRSVLGEGYHRENDEDGDDAYLLYNPASNVLCRVYDRREYNLDVFKMTTEVDETGTCYLREKGYEGDKFHKVTLDFSGDRPIPTVRIQSNVERPKCDIEEKDARRRFLLFDKQKLKTAREKLSCSCHSSIFM